MRHASVGEDNLGITQETKKEENKLTKREERHGGNNSISFINNRRSNQITKEKAHESMTIWVRGEGLEASADLQHP